MHQLGIVKLSEFEQELGNTQIHNSLIVRYSGYWPEVENHLLPRKSEGVIMSIPQARVGTPERAEMLFNAWIGGKPPAAPQVSCPRKGLRW